MDITATMSFTPIEKRLENGLLNPKDDALLVAVHEGKSIREMCVLIGLASTNAVSKRLVKPEDRKLLSNKPGQHRGEN